MSNIKKIFISFLVILSLSVFCGAGLYAQEIDKQDKEKHLLLALGGGVFNPFNEIGSVLGIGGSAKFLLQYNRIHGAGGLGFEAEAGYRYIPAWGSGPAPSPYNS